MVEDEEGEDENEQNKIMMKKKLLKQFNYNTVRDTCSIYDSIQFLLQVSMYVIHFYVLV